MKQSRGFTIIELLVSVVITSILATLLFLGVKSYIKSGQRAAELSAGKTLISAFHAYAADNNGQLIRAMDLNPGKIVDNKGKPVMSHAAKRWPWRLAPYFNYDMNTLMVNNKDAIKLNDSMYSYLVTVFPTFGMNGIFVGGKFGTSMAPDNPRSKKGNFCVTTIIGANTPSKLIVFSSAKIQGEMPPGTEGPKTGCFDVSAPGYGAVGEVHYKYSDKAVVAYFDGHVELNSEEELKDMRRWSNLAAIQDNPNWSF
jgi:prepilin-type N-terminal cleavage/methylation domain-containing protein/prepilin-type processing-associated H-X9-DG protein